MMKILCFGRPDLYAPNLKDATAPRFHTPPTSTIIRNSLPILFHKFSGVDKASADRTALGVGWGANVEKTGLHSSDRKQYPRSLLRDLGVIEVNFANNYREARIIEWQGLSTTYLRYRT
jgi:hypothetical protein